MLTNSELLSDVQIDEVARYFGSLPPPPAARAGLEARDIAAGRQLFEQGKPDAGVAACASCHAGPGVPGIVVPRIEAQHAGYLRKQLTDFRSGARTNDPDGLMRRVAIGLADDEITAVAAYVASLTRPEGIAR